MRYLKSYLKLSESRIEEMSDIDRDLTEICYELTDGRFHININWTLNYGGVENGKILFICLEDYRDYDGFSFDEVKEVVLRIIDYLGDKYIGCSILPVGEVDRLVIPRHLQPNTGSDIYEICKITNLAIKYKFK
jgi:hypothetical protein